MFRDDIEALPDDIPDNYDHTLVLAEQIQLVYRHLPLALLGTIFTALCFFATIYINFDLNFNQKALNAIWIIYQAVVIILLWIFLQRIFIKPKAVTLKSLRYMFVSLVVLFGAAILLGVPLFISMLYRMTAMELTAAKSIIGIWVFFHACLIYACWVMWNKVKVVAYLPLNNSFLFNQTISRSKSSSSKTNTNKRYIYLDNLSEPSLETSSSLYLAHYAAYSLIFICTFAIGCLWSLAVCKAFTTNTQNATQIIVLLGLHLGLLSGAISSLAIFWRIYFAYILPSVFIWVFIVFYVEDVSFIVLALAIIVLLFFNLFWAKHTWQNTLKSILLSLENGNLVAQLQIKSKQVEEASLAKTQFLAAASHDLRQPVHALSLFIEALGDTDLDDKQTQIVDYAKSASQSSREMLNTILDYAHLESGQMIPHFVPTDLNSIIQNLVDEFGIQAENKNLSLRFKPTDIWVMTDPTMVALILRNFISNAIRYTHKGGVLIGVRHFSMDNRSILIDYCQLSVWDTGSGMTMRETSQVFESFYQIERNKTTDQGLGLGLAIVKGMTQLLKAGLTVKSNLEVGSQFSVILPICEPLKDTISTNHTFINYLAGNTVLVVDDDDSVLKSMQLLLQTWGCQAHAVSTLIEAVKIFETELPDIVITDFRLANGVTGEDVIMAIDNINTSSKRPSFVILTADTTPQLFTTTKAINPVVLHKPIDPKNLRQQLQQIVANRT